MNLIMESEGKKKAKRKIWERNRPQNSKNMTQKNVIFTFSLPPSPIAAFISAS
jgi:hypothetical protein